jgi:hypothetical protein
MVGRTDRGGGPGDFTLLILCTTASVLLLTVALLVTSSEDVAGATPFGRLGTVAVTVGAAVVVCASAAVARRSAGSTPRAIATGLSIAATALVGVLAFLFLFADSGQFAVGLLLACATVLVAMGGRVGAQVSGTKEAR